MPYTSIYASGKKSSSSTHDYSQDFTPGQYYKVNQKILADKVVKQKAQTKKQADEQVRQQAKQNAFQKAAHLANQIVVKPTVNTAEKVANTGAAAVAGVSALTRLPNAKNKKKVISDANKEIDKYLSKGVGGAGGYLSPQQAASSGGGAKSLKKNFINPTSQAVSEIAPYTPVGKTAKGASLAYKVAKGVIDNTVLNTATTVGNEVVQHGKSGLSKKYAGETAKNLALAGIVGGAIPGVHGGVKAGVKNVTEKAAQVADTSTSKTVQKVAGRMSLGKATDDLQKQKDNLTQLKTQHPNAPELDKAIQNVDKKIVEVQKTSDKQAVETQKTTEKNAAEVKKIDQQTELIQAKKKDTGKTSAVDTVKLKQLKERKAEIHSESPVVTSESPVVYAKSSTESTPVQESPTTVKASTPKVPDTTSGSASRSEAKAVEAGLTKEFKDKAQYKGESYKTEAQNAVDLIDKDPEKAMNIAMGREPGNNTIHEVAVARALEHRALQKGDVETLRQLATSPRHTVTSEAAQRLGAEGFHNETNSPVDIMQRISEARKAATKSHSKQSIPAIKKEIKASVKKSTKTDWKMFVESIQC